LNLYGRSFNSLSGGEKQKVSLTRCLVQNAKLLLLDEPTAALDSENKKMVKDILLSLSVTEIPTIIVVTHDKELSLMNGWQQLNLDLLGDANE
jgi:ABC-type lipoprotein export system ATPase subunit